MATNNVHITKKDNENTMSVLKRFTQKFRSTGIVQTVKGRRFLERKPSALTQKQAALRRINRNAERTLLDKLGKLK